MIYITEGVSTRIRCAKERNTVNIYTVTSIGDKKHHPRNKTVIKEYTCKTTGFSPIYVTINKIHLFRFQPKE